MTTPARTLRSADDLAAAGLVPPEARAQAETVAARYAVAITPTLVQHILAGEEAIARQFLPDARELIAHPAELADPIGDHVKSPTPGIVHRYADRVLLKIVHVCPVYCRFCFRREMVGPDHGETLSAAELDAALAYIAATPAVREVILTGGDPFILSPRRVREITKALSTISHVKTLRWHTRVPAVDPDRVSEAFVAALTDTDRRVVVAAHVNHARELTPASRDALSRLSAAGVALLSQSVLLRGINDRTDTLIDLFDALRDAGVAPYYLHHGDLAPGTAHFRVPLARGLALMAQVRKRLAGQTVPAYVLDLPGGFGKVPLSADRVAHRAHGYEIIDAAGRTHIYRDACASA